MSVNQIVDLSTLTSNRIRVADKLSLFVSVENSIPLETADGWVTIGTTPLDPGNVKFQHLYTEHFFPTADTGEWECRKAFASGKIVITYAASYPQNTTARYEIRVMGQTPHGITFYPQNSIQFPLGPPRQGRCVEDVPPLNIPGEKEIGIMDAVVVLENVQVGDIMRFDILALTADQPDRVIGIYVYVNELEWDHV